MSSYEKLLRIKKESRFDHFVLALGYFFDIGYQAASQITEEDIENAEENGIMSKDFVQWMMETVHLITEVTDSAIEVVQFCMAEDIFEVNYYANKVPRYRLEEMIKSRMWQERYNVTENEGCEKICELYECDKEELKMLGYNVPEEEE